MPGLTSTDLKNRLIEAGHEVSKRTVERDLIRLSCIFPVLCNDKGTPFGWYWMPGSTVDLPSISLSEALTLSLAEGSIRPLIPGFMLQSLEPRFNLARQKLNALSGENASARWLEKVASVHPEFSLAAPEICPEILSAIQQALLNDTQLGCIYYAAHQDEVRSLTLNPLALVQRGQITYLIATAVPFEDPRQYAIHRFKEARVLINESVKPENFGLQQYISTGKMQFATQGKIRLQAWVNEGLARLVCETPLSADMQLIKQEDGSTLTATVNDSWELRWWILSHAGSIQVQKPKSLATEITARLRAALVLQESSGYI